jgi:hypothetical protein
VFELQPVFAAEIRERFGGKGAIIIHELALGISEGILTLSDGGDA